MKLKNCNCEIPYWDECNKNKVKWYKKGKMKRILRKKWIAKILTVLKKLRRAGKKLNKKDLLSSTIATKKGYCTQRSNNLNTEKNSR